MAGASDSIPIQTQGSITAFACDAKGNFYLANSANTLVKLDASGKEITNVNTKVYGSISSIDCSNPFEIYVYHQSQNILVFYDNMLNQRGVMKFNDMGLNTVTQIARSYDNGIWIYDNSDFQLKKLDK
jgi:hypothetical protein